MTSNARATKTHSSVLLASWLSVAIPLAWGVSETFSKALALFQ